MPRKEAVKFRPTIASQILFAVVGIPVLMFGVPPLINAHSTLKFDLGVALGVAWLLVWATLILRIVRKILNRRLVDKLLNHKER